jgi:hypothetical protein
VKDYQNPLVLADTIAMHAAPSLPRCYLTALARFRWFNLDLDNIFLERHSLLQKAASLTLKEKREEKR